MNDFETFYRSHLRFVYALALARDAAPCRAEDLVQETFIRAWRAFARLSGLQPPEQRAWLAHVLRYLAIDRWRRTHAPAPVEQLPELIVGPEERVALRLDVQRALAALDEADRELVLLRYFLQMNSREIAEVLEIPEGTVRSRLMNCRRHLAAQLAGWDPEGHGAS